MKSPEQLEAITYFKSDLCLIAGAGSGKTTVLVERYLHAVTKMGADPKRVLAITFTDKAANEMKKRLVESARHLGLDWASAVEQSPIGTIHSFCADLLREYPIEAGVSPKFSILSEGDAEILKDESLSAVWEAQSSNREWILFLSRFKERPVREALTRYYDFERAYPDTQKKGAASRDVGLFFEMFTAFKNFYEAEKKRRQSLDFEDLTHKAYLLLADEGVIGRAVRNALQERYTAIFVDEFQDTSPLQAAIIRRLKREANLFVVGDPRQSIYRFRYADPQIFESMSLGQQMSLNDNYRSREEILDFINWASGNLFSSKNYRPLVAKRAAQKSESPVLELLILKREKGSGLTLEDLRIVEARTLAERIHRLVRVEKKYKFKDIAMLFRSTTALRLYERELAQAQIPYSAARSEGFLERPEVRDLICVLTLLGRPEDDLSLAAVLRSPLVGIGEDALYWLAQEAKSKDSKRPLWGAIEAGSYASRMLPEDADKISKFKTWLTDARSLKNEKKVSDILNGILKASGYLETTLRFEDGHQKFANVWKFVELGQSFVDEFLKMIGSLASNETQLSQANIQPENADVVTLSTVHAAKGLEFPCVIVADMGAGERKSRFGNFVWDETLGFGVKGEPLYEEITAKIKSEDSQEQKRALYVALTRAKDQLILSGAEGEEGSWMNVLLGADGIPASFAAAHLTPVEADFSVSAERPTEKARSQAPKIPKDIEARIALPEKPYDQVRDLSVSDILSMQAPDAERSQDFKQEEPLHDFDPDEQLLPRNEFGTLYHKALEILVTRRSKTVSKKFLNSFTLKFSKEDRAEFNQSVINFWRSDLAKEIRASKSVFPELPFLYKTKRGLLKGQIDLVFQNAKKEWVIVDYKTNAIDPEEKESTAAKYALQLSLYGLVFSKLYGKNPSKGILYFSRLNDISALSFSEGKLTQMQTQLEGVFESAANPR